MNAPLLTSHRDPLRDLRILTHSPSLISARGALEEGGFDVLTLQARRAWRELLERAEEHTGEGREARERLEQALELHVELSARRLGLYAERLLLSLIDALPQHELLAHNLQVQGEDKRTLGALDMLLKTPQGVAHWELAVKFYLHAPEVTRAPSASWGAWLGPNGRDTMALKLNKLCAHQLPLSHTPEARALLTSLGHPQPTVRTALCVGHLFERWDRPAPRPVEAGEAFDQPHRDLWARWSERALALQAHSTGTSSTSKWQVFTHPHWLSLPSQALSPLMSAEEVLALPVESLEHGRNLMLAELDAQGACVRRWMWVADAWGLA